MMESSFYYLDDTHATTSSSSAKKKERNESSIHNNSVKRSPSFVVDLTDSPISKRQSLEESKVELKVELEGELNESSSEESKDEYKEEATTSATATTTVTTKNQPTIGNSSNTTFIPPIRIGGTSLLPTSVSNRLSVGSTVSTSDSPVTEAKESKITLSTSQKRAVDAIMARKSVFFSGAAGSGKSFLLKVVQDVLDSIDKGDRIAFTAPTGVAACNIRGMTIHAWAGIGLGKDTLERLVGPIMRNREVRNRWTETDILVIDEISMLSGEIFDLLSQVGSRVRNDPRPFGGLQLVMCGDFFQLPPVGLGKSCTFCFQSETWREIFYNSSSSGHGSNENPPAEMIFLHKGFRQNDNTFLRVLNELRRGVVSRKTEEILTEKVNEFKREQYEKIKLLNAARIAAAVDASKVSSATTSSSSSTGATSKATVTPLHSKSKKEVSKEVVATKLYSTNKNVDEYNDSELRKLSAKSYIFNSADEGSEQFIKQLRAGMKAVETLELKVGAQVLLLKNLDTSRGLVNGAKGVVIGFEMQFISAPPSSSIANAFQSSVNKPTNDPCLPIVQFEISRGNGVKTTEIMTLKREKWELLVRDRVVASRVQIPLMLAWAISIHKAQGMTIPDLEVSFQGIFEYGQAYVALSRATSLEGLHLQSFERNAVRAHELVKEFYIKRMRAGEEIDPRDEPCLQSSVSELAVTFQESTGPSGSNKRNNTADRRESGEWIKPKSRNDADSGDRDRDHGVASSDSSRVKTAKGAWDDWRNIDAVDDWEVLKFEKSKTTPRHSDADVCEQNGAASKVPSTVTDTPQPAAFRLASLLNRNDSEPDVTSHSSSSAGKYLHSQQQDIRDTWSRERSGKNTETKTLYQPQPQRNSLTAQQQSSFAIMKNNLFVPPAAAATYAPSSTPAAITTLTEEQKRRIEENRQAALRKQAAFRLQQQQQQQDE